MNFWKWFLKRFKDTYWVLVCWVAIAHCIWFVANAPMKNYIFTFIIPGLVYLQYLIQEYEHAKKK
jgi:hypothetical protein